MRYFFVTFIFFAAFSCEKEEETVFSIEPKIQFENILFVKGKKSFNLNPLDTIFFTFYFSDGDADLGREYDYYYETQPPFNPIFFLNKVNGEQIPSNKLFNNTASVDELVSYSDKSQPPYDTLPTFEKYPCNWFIYSKEITIDTLYSIKNQNFYNIDISIFEDSPNGFIQFWKCADYDGLIPPIKSYVSSKRSDGPFSIKLKSAYDGTITFKMSILGEHFGPRKLKVRAKVIEESGHESNTIESSAFDIF
ncbi:MAG: hypothetical protein RIA63_09135 [Cyclobacteriaceae bacterium]